jgi:hypothetical protein
MRRGCSRLLVGASALLFVSTAVTAQRGGGGGGGANNAIATLKGVAVPQPANLDRYVADQPALVALGKALFWDAQVGSDGRTAWATWRIGDIRGGEGNGTSPTRRLRGQSLFLAGPLALGEGAMKFCLVPRQTHEDRRYSGGG